MAIRPKPDEGSGLGGLAAFAADVLDWAAVRALFVPYAPSNLALRALAELVPLEDEAARAALQRVRELLQAAAAGESPPLRGHPDPLPAVSDARRTQSTLGGEDLDGVARFLRAVDETATWLAARADLLPTCSASLRGRPDTADLRAELERSIDE